MFVVWQEPKLKTRFVEEHNGLYYIEEVKHHLNQQVLLSKTLLTQSKSGFNP